MGNYYRFSSSITFTVGDLTVTAYGVIKFMYIPTKVSTSDNEITTTTITTTASYTDVNGNHAYYKSPSSVSVPAQKAHK